MRGIRMENGRILYFGNLAGYVTGNKAVVDPLFSGDGLNRFLEKQKGIREVEWRDGIYDRLMNGQDDLSDGPVLKNIRIWQLKPSVDVHMKFIGYDRMRERFGEPSPEDYQLVFDGEAETNNLEEIYNKFNAGLHPPGYTGHSLSMSDVIELYDGEGSEFHYVDERGFKTIAFGGPEPAQSPIMQL